MVAEANKGSSAGRSGGCFFGLLAALGGKSKANVITEESCRLTLTKLVLSNQAVNDSVSYKEELIQLSAQHAKVKGPVNQAVAFLLQARADNPSSNYESEARGSN